MRLHKVYDFVLERERLHKSYDFVLESESGLQKQVCECECDANASVQAMHNCKSDYKMQAGGEGSVRISEITKGEGWIASWLGSSSCYGFYVYYYFKRKQKCKSLMHMHHLSWPRVDWRSG